MPTGLMFLDDDECKKLLARYCADVGVPLEVIEEMIAAEVEGIGKQRRDGIHETLLELVMGTLESEDN